MCRPMPAAVSDQAGPRARLSASPAVAGPAGAPRRPCWFPPVFLPPGAASGWCPSSLSPLLFCRLSVACRPSLLTILPSKNLPFGAPPFRHPPRWELSPLPPIRACALPRWCPSLCSPLAGSAASCWRLSLVVRPPGVALPRLCPSLVATLPCSPPWRPLRLEPPPAGIPRRWRLSLVVFPPWCCPLIGVPLFGGAPPWWSPLASVAACAPPCCHPSTLAPLAVVPLPAVAPPWWRPSLLVPLPLALLTDGSSPCFCASLLALLLAVARTLASTRRWEHCRFSGNIWLHKMQKKRRPSCFCRPFSSCGTVASKNATSMVVYLSSKTYISGSIFLSLSRWTNQIKAFDDPG